MAAPSSNQGQDEPKRWLDLAPDPGILTALKHAGVRPTTGGREPKHEWSNKFADGCAVAFADAFRNASSLRKKVIRPVSLLEGAEPLTPLGAGSSKRIDVTVADPVLGLEIGVSLKGLNFMDGKNKNYDKNVTGRLYELGDEVRLVHEHLPHCFMVGVFLLPLEASADKKSDKSASSFANAVMKLRERTGRLDAALAGHSARCDASFVGLYTTGADGFPAGITRFFNSSDSPPRRGRPLVQDTIDLVGLVENVVARATYSTRIIWGEAEQD